MYTLTLFNAKRQLEKTIETFDPVDQKIIEQELKAIGPGAWCDVSRRELLPEDFDYRDEN